VLARLVRIALALELLAYLAIGFGLHARGLDFIALVLIAVGFALGARLALVVVSSALSSMASAPRASAQRLGAFGWLALVAREWRALVADNFAYLPFERAFMGRDEPSATKRLPVVLLHGYFGNRGYFHPLRRFLGDHGVAPVFAPNFRATFATIEAYGEQLRAAIETIAAGTGQARVVLVAHSMGGLAARWYLCRYGSARVAKVITLASPHGGTTLAPFGLGSNARQMRRGSDFLAALARCEEKPPACPFTSIYSPHDNLVAPHDAPVLAYARNIALAGHGHLGVLMAPEAHAIVLAELSEAGVDPAR
jgi:triacylglycerol esterase/lipase EstA (alpha/beta hydrolase family)